VLVTPRIRVATLLSIGRAPIGAAVSANGQWQRARLSVGVVVATDAR